MFCQFKKKFLQLKAVIDEDLSVINVHSARNYTFWIALYTSLHVHDIYHSITAVSFICHLYHQSYPFKNQPTGTNFLLWWKSYRLIIISPVLRTGGTSHRLSHKDTSNWWRLSMCDNPQSLPIFLLPAKLSRVSFPQVNYVYEEETSKYSVPAI